MTLGLPDAIQSVIRAIVDAGGKPYVVGGAIRDMLLGQTPNDDNLEDMDFEVYDLAIDPLLATLRRFGRVETVGKSFGVVKLWMKGMTHFDFALPRRESKTGRGHRGFMVEPDPEMTPKEACGRRDFTINAMLLNPLTNEILDFFGGQDDLKNGILRHTSSHFGEDPLRVLRAVQFSGRFGMKLHPKTAALCRDMISEAPTLAVERIWAEWEKWAVKSTHHSQGLTTLRDSGWVSVFPELAALIGLEQDPVYHPEGDVWQHTLLAVDAAHQVALRDGLDEGDRLVLILAALCHDLGKPDTTQTDDNGRIRSLGHASTGQKRTESLLNGIGAPAHIIKRVVPLVAEHMTVASASSPTKRAVKRLAHRLAPETITMLTRVVEADCSARPPTPPNNPCKPWSDLAAQLHLETGPPEPLLLGRDLIPLGISPGPEMGKLLRAGFTAQLDGEFETKDDAIEWAKRRLDSIRV